MIYATITLGGWNVRLTKRKHLIYLVDVQPDQPVEKNLSEAFRAHACLSWIFKQMTVEGYLPEDHEITLESSEKLKPFLSGQKIPKSPSGAEHVSKSRMILNRFKKQSLI